MIDLGFEPTDPVAPSSPDWWSTAPSDLVLTIHDLVTRQAELRPETVAVTYVGDNLTYLELDRRSTDLAKILVHRGTGVGDRVGVCLDRSINLVIALLAVLKAGAAYVPLDPGYPPARLALITEDTDVQTVLIERDAPFDFEGVLVHPADWALADPATVLPTVTMSSAAYVIYTSGSTGRPKGVQVPHSNVIALVRATATGFGFGCDDVWSLFHSYSFDFSVWEIWGALLTGGRLTVVPSWTARDPDDFLAFLAAESVTVLNQTPSAYSQLPEANGFERGELVVRLLVLGGEALETRTLAAWIERYPDCRVENMYGITETTVHSSWRTITAADTVAGCRSIGRPLPGWSLYVLGDDGGPVPPGESGEIHVGGDGLADGYFRRPGLTAERFVADRISGAPGGRLYRSGDIGRVTPDGEIECLGRQDDQVKIRGHRIELGEIRGVLMEAPQVARCVVVVRNAADPVLASIDAYVVAAEEPDPRPGIRALMATRLPAYMMPGTLTCIDRLPLTASGKLDVASLPEPGGPGVQVDERDDIASRIGRVWSGILGFDVGPEANFFEVGGNSLLVARLGRALQEAGLAATSLRDIYAHPTQAAMIELIRRKTL